VDSYYCPCGYEPGDCCNDPTRCETENDLVDRLAKDGAYDRPPLNPDKPGKAASAATNPDAVLQDFTDYIADLITSGIADDESCPDFLIALPEQNRRAYFDVEAAEVFVITVERGRIEVAQ